MSPDTVLRVTVCQLRSEPESLEEEWEQLVAHVCETQSDLVLLPEMPFFAWPFWQDQFQPEVWEAAVAAHDSWLARLGDLSPAVVTGSRPVTKGDRRFNCGFIWSPNLREVQLGHGKFYLPDEAGFWEGSWYARGDGRFEPEVIGVPGAGTVCSGFLICTELWFMQEARRYGQSGVELLLTPRATEKQTVDKWLAAGRVAAVIAGAYSLSSNHYREGSDPVSLGGLGWVIGPDGEVLALTTPSNPFATVGIALEQARQAKKTYPRYVAD